MYAFAFDCEIAALQAQYGKHAGRSWNNAYPVVRDTLAKHGFTWVQGSVYHVDTDDMGVLVLALQDLIQLPWFPPSVRDIRAYRVEQWSDFTPVVKRAMPR